MAVNLSIKGVPDEIANQLRARAERNHRSLQGELMAIVEQAAAEAERMPAQPPTHPPSAAAAPGRATDRVVRQGSKTIAQIAQELRALYPQPAADLPKAVDIVRELRDSR